MKCQAKVDRGKSLIRGFHHLGDCSLNAKYKVYLADGKEEEKYMYFCTRHLKSFLLHNCNSDKYNIEKL